EVHPRLPAVHRRGGAHLLPGHEQDREAGHCRHGGGRDRAGPRRAQHLLLEIIFQIAVFSALALGLNIVVGFSGLLNFGYMAFYAVGAYLWGFFGSQQPFLLHAIPGTVPAGTPFFLAPDWFYL